MKMEEHEREKLPAQGQNRGILGFYLNVLQGILVNLQNGGIAAVVAWVITLQRVFVWIVCASSSSCVCVVCFGFV